jgi:ketosteroid isomerase-like protein
MTQQRPFAALGAALALTLAAPAEPHAAPNDAQRVAQLHSEWILQGWEKAPGDGPFDFRRQLGRFYDLEARDLLLYDDFDPQRRVARSADEYGAFWAPHFTRLRSARHWVVDAPLVLTTGDLAASTLEFSARLEGPDGEVVAIRTRSSLVWARRAAGWKIVREHNSSTVITEAELARLNQDAAER